jgi:hypothetical protein
MGTRSVHLLFSRANHRSDSRNRIRKEGTLSKRSISYTISDLDLFKLARHRIRMVKVNLMGNGESLLNQLEGKLYFTQ